MLEQPSADAPLTPHAAPVKADRSFISFLKTAGSVAISAAKWAWRVDAVKSVALTWIIRAAPAGAVVAALVDSYLGGA